MSNNNLFQSTNYFKLDRAFFIRMLELEKLFHNKEIIISQIGEVVGMYARCVEYYDSIKDDSKYYYMDKIQYVLSRKESLEQIFKEGTPQVDQQKSKSKLPADNLLVSDFVIDLNFNDPNKADRDFKINSIRCSVTGKQEQQLQQPRESVSRRKLQGEYKMNVDYYEHINQQDTTVKHIVEETEQKFDKNDEIIKKDLSNQDQLMMERIARKKARINQNKKKVQRANSFDDQDINQNGRINTDSTIEINNQDNKNNNNQTQIITTPSIDDTDSTPHVQSNMSKKDKINELKETFDLSYSKLFTSISQKTQRQSIAKRFEPKQDETVQFTLAKSNLFETDELNRESSTTVLNNILQENLESILSTHAERITIRGNPFEEEDSEDEEEIQDKRKMFKLNKKKN